MLTVCDLKTEYRINPIGIDEQHPVFSWKLRSDIRDTFQKSFRIHVTLDGKTQWDTGILDSDRNLYIPYAEQPLLPGSRYDVTVTVTGQPWSGMEPGALPQTGSPTVLKMVWNPARFL